MNRDDCVVSINRELSASLQKQRRLLPRDREKAQRGFIRRPKSLFPASDAAYARAQKVSKLRLS